MFENILLDLRHNGIELKYFTKLFVLFNLSHLSTWAKLLMSNVTN
jgi:hypothetical protein